MTAAISVADVRKQYGPAEGGLTVFEDVSFAVEEGEFVVVVGPSGCGKTTLLKLVAGLVEPTGGEIAVGGQPVDGPTDDAAMVFQDFVLLPWKSVLENVALGLRLQGEDDATCKRVARDWIDTVGLAGYEEHYPRDLSGGMRQRVGLARALAVDPSILLMDEPFGSIDAQTRSTLQNELLELWADHRKTVLFVTHDIDEAIFLADRVLVLSETPATIAGEIPVDIDRPRWDRRLEVERSEEFARVKRYVRERLGLAPE